MARPRASIPNKISDAVRELRQAFNETQQQFAQRSGVAIATVARWETTQPPRGKALARLRDLAQKNNLHEIAVSLGLLLIHDARNQPVLGIRSCRKRLAELLTSLGSPKASPEARILETIETLAELIPEMEYLERVLLEQEEDQ